LRVEIVDPDRMSLAGLMVGSLLGRNLADERLAARARRMRGPVAVDAGGMRLVLEFGGDTVRVRRGECERPRVTVTATLDALLDVALGGGAVGAFLGRRVRFRGNPFVALRMLPLLRVRS